MRTLIIFLVLIVPFLSMAQFSGENAALNNLKKGKWEKAHAQLSKAVKKDSVNTTAHYGLAVYFFTPANPAFQIDSAYRYVMQSLSDFRSTTQKQRDRLKKIPLDSGILIRHRERVDSAAFVRAKEKNTESGYIDFLEQFSFASQRAQASELRDEVAYLDALKENTYEAFLKYLEKYPLSGRSADAKSRYEKLLFESKTKDKKLTSYKAFLDSYPATPFRAEVEKQIFEITTAPGDVETFEIFLKKYPESSQARKAKNIMYHLLKENEIVSLSIAGDSLKNIERLQRQNLIPFLKNDKFGFMNEQGEEVMKPFAREIPDEYLCGNVQDEWLVLDNQIIARDRFVIYRGPIDEVDDLGYGFLKVKSKNCARVIHLTGFQIGDACLQDAKLLSKNLLALQKENRWSVWTLAGRKLIDYEWDEVREIERVIVFQKSKKHKLASVNEVSKVADQLTVSFTREYDEVKSFSNGLIWVRHGNQQGALDQNLRERVKLELQEITQTYFSVMARTPIETRLYTAGSDVPQKFFKAIINEPWVAVRKEGSWHLIDPNDKQFISPGYDSIQFVGPIPVAIKNDSIRIYIEKEKYVDALQTVQVRFRPGKDSVFFLILIEGDKKTVVNSKGVQLFSAVFDKIEYNNEGFFTVLKKDRYGLVGLDGKVLIHPDYQALGTVSEGIVQTLKDKKFGMIDLPKRREIKVEYEKNLVKYNARVLTAFKNGFYGLIGWDNKIIVPFEFEEIRYWNDSTAIVKKNFNWMFYNFIEKKIELDKIKAFKWVLNSEDEKVLIVQQENAYGVISNKRGTIIPTTFTDIVNLGSETNPLYFTEKHVEEASIFVVIYYDKNGAQIRKEVYETADYEKIYCSGSR